MGDPQNFWETVSAETPPAWPKKDRESIKRKEDMLDSSNSTDKEQAD